MRFFKYERFTKTPSAPPFSIAAQALLYHSNHSIELIFFKMLYTKISSAALLALIGYAMASPVKLSKRDDQIIGYRRVSKVSVCTVTVYRNLH